MERRRRLYTVMVHLCAALLLLLVLVPVAVAAEGRSIQVTCQGPLSFSQAELERALRLRLPLMRLPAQGELPAATVQALPPHRAVIVVGGAGGTSRRFVSLKDLSGADAARIVALLILDQAANLSRSPERESTSTLEEPIPGLPAPSDFIYVGISPRLSLGVREWAPAFGPTVDVAVRVYSLLLAFVEAGFTWTTAGDGEEELTLYEVPVRAGLGLRYRFFEARLGAVIRPYWVTGAGDDSGVLAGGSLGLHFRRVLTGWLTGYVAAGVDLLTPRKDFRVDGETVMTTSWAVPWVGLGAGWQGG